jgi:hypothetical protein
MSDLSATYEVRGTPAAIVTPAEWQSRVEELRALLGEVGLPPERIAADLREAFGGITFRDAGGFSWRHDGTAWWRWVGGNWATAVPPAQLVVDKVEFAVDPDDLTAPGEDRGEWAPPEEMVFEPTHIVPPGGVTSWSEPDPTRPAGATIDGLLDVQVLEQRPDGWARVLCANGWSAWVDGRLLLAAAIEPSADGP